MRAEHSTSESQRRTTRIKSAAIAANHARKVRPSRIQHRRKQYNRRRMNNTIGRRKTTGKTDDRTNTAATGPNEEARQKHRKKKRRLHSRVQQTKRPGTPERKHKLRDMWCMCRVSGPLRIGREVRRVVRRSVCFQSPPWLFLSRSWSLRCCRPGRRSGARGRWRETRSCCPFRSA